MRKAIVASTLALAVFAVGSEASAQQWGLHSGDTVRSGDNMLYSEIGWPDLTLGFQHGVSDKVDVGFRFSFDYGAEYTPYTLLGMGMRVPIRIAAIKRDKFSFLIHFDPGIKFDSFGGYLGGCGRFGCGGGYFYGGSGLRFGLWIPLGLEFGIHINRDATISFGMEVPIYINLTNGGYGAIPILFGPGFEYHVDEHIAVGINAKFGPSIFAVGDGFGGSTSSAGFGFIMQPYFAYRL